MYLLLSGEGSSDIGICNPSADYCDRDDFKEGPMAIIVDQLVEVFQGYEFSHLESNCVGFVHKSFLADHKLDPQRRAMHLKGKKCPAETKYYFENARVLAKLAQDKSKEIEDVVVAVLFRDTDDTSSAGRGEWEYKRKSMINGFKSENFEFGVAMIPKQKSEAWLLCATKSAPYKNCAALENESGNDDSPNPLKKQLANSLKGNSSISELNHLLQNRSIDINKIDMPSFNTFKADLEDAVKRAIKL